MSSVYCALKIRQKINKYNTILIHTYYDESNLKCFYLQSHQKIQNVYTKLYFIKLVVNDEVVSTVSVVQRGRNMLMVHMALVELAHFKNIIPLVVIIVRVAHIAVHIDLIANVIVHEMMRCRRGGVHQVLAHGRAGLLSHVVGEVCLRFARAAHTRLCQKCAALVVEVERRRGRVGRIDIRASTIRVGNS